VVSRVEFYVDGRLQCADSAAPFECAFKTAAKAGRNYKIQAVAYDSAGNAGQSSVVQVTSR
jgi:thermitase